MSKIMCPIFYETKSRVKKLLPFSRESSGISFNYLNSNFRELVLFFHEKNKNKNLFISITQWKSLLSAFDFLSEFLVLFLHEMNKSKNHETKSQVKKLCTVKVWNPNIWILRHCRHIGTYNLSRTFFYLTHTFLTSSQIVVDAWTRDWMSWNTGQKLV